MAEPTSASTVRSRRAAAAAFGAYAVLALGTLVFILADHRWFFRDDWAFLSGRDISVDGLFAPHFEQHLSAVPVVVFRAMWSLFGATSYVPYQLLIAATHLTVAVLLRAVLRHVGVGPWPSTCAAAILVLWGPGGGDNLTWAFQINFTGAMAFGLGQLLLADHDGRARSRDLAAIALGLLAVLSSAIGVTMVLVVGFALLVMHGWRSALLQTVPPALLVLVWMIATGPATESPAGPPPDVATTLRWVGWSFEGALRGLGGASAVAVALTSVTALGLALRILESGSGDRIATTRERRGLSREVAIPLAMLVGTLFFAITTARGRWVFGEAGAKAGRYLYVIVVLLLPVVAVAVEELSRRWPRLRHPLLLLLLLPIPFNLDGFDEPPFDANFFARQKALLTGTVQMELAREVPRSNHPPGYDPTMGEDMTIGFLLEAHRQGKLPSPGSSLSPKLEAELTIRLAIRQDPEAPAPSHGCEPVELPAVLRPERGDLYRIDDSVVMRLDDSPTSSPSRVIFNPWQGETLEFQVGGLTMRASGRDGSQGLAFCNAGS